MCDRVFYHVTLQQNLPSIFREGLIPQIGKLSASYGEPVPAVYLFDSREAAEDAIVNWLGDALDDIFGEGIEEAILEVQIPNSFFVTHSESDFEWRCFQTIPPKYIKKV